MQYDQIGNGVGSMRVAMLALALTLAISGQVAAEPLEDGLAALERGDKALAVQWFRKAADQGNAGGQFMLGNMYDNGQGVPQDYVLAMQWYRKAADQGDAMAQNNLGNMYDNGQGVPKDYALAVQWYRKAADQGDARGQANLGGKYANGQGVPKDYTLAYMWSNLGAAGGNELGGKNRDAVAALMTSAQIGEAQRLSREWKPTGKR